MDLGGVGFSHINSPFRTFFNEVSKESVSLFPETLHATILANMPFMVVNAIWPIAKMVMHPVTQEKTTLLNSPAALTAKLQELLEPEDIPAYFGGRCQCEECQSGKLRGGSLWIWEEENGLFLQGDAQQKEQASAEQSPVTTEAETSEQAPVVKEKAGTSTKEDEKDVKS